MGVKETKLNGGMKTSDGKELKFASDFDRQPTFVIGSIGRYSSGKTRLAVTGPDITAILPIDQKSRRTIEKGMKELGKKFGKNIIMPDVDWIDELNPMQANRLDEAQSKTFYRNRVETVKEYALALFKDPAVKMICIDTFAQFYQDVCFALYGRAGHKYKQMDGGKGFQDRSDANQEVKDFIKSIGRKPLLLTNPEKDDYDKNKVVGKTNEGYKYLGNSCELMIRHEMNNQYDEDDEENNWRFALTIKACQDKMELQGPEGYRVLVDEMINMKQLLRLGFPDQKWEW